MKHPALLLKRIFDVLFAASVLIVFSPVMAMTGIFITCCSPEGRVLFRQRRPGLHGRPFTIYKFRTMTEERDFSGNLLPAEMRLKKWGHWLRKLNLDELPQMWNIIKGDMSLIGPRPLLMQYLPLYTPRQMRRHDMRPGITGLTAVKGRNSITWEDRFAYDIDYVDHWSIRLDVKIFFLTIRNEFFSRRRSGDVLTEIYKGTGSPGKTAPDKKETPPGR